MKRNGKRNEQITVSALSKTQTFASRQELEAYVAELDARGWPYGPSELACRQAVHSGSTATVFPDSEPPPPPRTPTPYDEDLAAAEARVAEREQAYERSKATWFDTEDRATEQLSRVNPAEMSAASLAELSALRTALGHRVRAAEAQYGKAAEALRRARAARNGIAATADAWRREQTDRYLHPSRPGVPLTLSELRELVEEEAL